MTATVMNRSFFSIFLIELIDNTKRDVKRKSCILDRILYQICEVKRGIAHMAIIFYQGSKSNITSVAKQFNVFKLAWELL